MKNLTLIVVLLLLSSGVFAQSPTKTNSLAEKEQAVPTPQQLIFGKWLLKSASGQTEINGQTVEGYIDFDAYNNFKGVMMGDEGKGTYRIINKNNQLFLETTEDNSNSEQLEIKSLTATQFILLADGAELLFVKQ